MHTRKGEDRDRVPRMPPRLLFLHLAGIGRRSGQVVGANHSADVSLPARGLAFLGDVSGVRKSKYSAFGDLRHLPLLSCTAYQAPGLEACFSFLAVFSGGLLRLRRAFKRLGVSSTAANQIRISCPDSNHSLCAKDTQPMGRSLSSLFPRNIIHASK